MKLGLFGGSFDPIHRGHVEPVRAARRALGLDRVLYLPTALPPHKPRRELAPAHARWAMVELALLGEEGLYADPYELTLGRPAYTVETLEHFRRTLPGAELHLLIGADSYLELPTWRRWRELPELARIVVLARPGSEVEETVAGARFLEQPPVDVSASRIRAHLAAGEAPPPGALHPLVLDYVRKYHLYR
ncbi:MAG TPA: nicotinate (nicotinamide) nucleotide adenylyltransferase [Thermoanaerobaculia bacterium]|nr:nicotinate (nicotinamide) nucleotide adenylyltransferase [Thermoanaerobaculia bacterium]